MRYKYIDKEKPKRRNRRWLWLPVLVLLLAVLLVLDSRYRPVVTEHTLTYDNLPPELDGFKIVALSDLHGMSFGKDNEKLTALVLAENPDLVVMTGDFLDAAGDPQADLSAVRTLCAGLQGAAPLYFVSGNHDWGSGQIQDLETVLAESGVRFLHNEYELLTHEGGQFVLAGVEDPNSWATMIQPDELTAEIARQFPDTFTILLGHRNYWAEKYPDLPVDLIFCGHAHGGIVRLPVLGGLLGTDHSLLPEHVDGVVQSGRYQLVISRGLGNSISIPRILNNPEILSVTLRSSGA